MEKKDTHPTEAVLELIRETVAHFMGKTLNCTRIIRLLGQTVRVRVLVKNVTVICELTFQSRCPCWGRKLPIRLHL